METTQHNFAQYQRGLGFFFFSLVAGSLLILAMFYFLQPEPSESLEGETATIYIPLLVLGLLVGAFFLGRNRIEAAREQRDLKEKLTAYRAALILRWAMIEGGVLLCGVFFFLSREMLLLAVAGVGLVALLLFIPSRGRTLADMDLSSSEQAQLDDPNFIIFETRPRGV